MTRDVMCERTGAAQRTTGPRGRKATTEAGVRLITVDRPGYGRSDPGRIGDHRRRGRKVNQLQARPNTAAPNVRKNVARRTRWYES